MDPPIECVIEREGSIQSQISHVFCWSRKLLVLHSSFVCLVQFWWHDAVALTLWFLSIIDDCRFYNWEYNGMVIQPCRLNLVYTKWFGKGKDWVWVKLLLDRGVRPVHHLYFSYISIASENIEMVMYCLSY
jgi:hypothetical protein